MSTLSHNPKPQSKVTGRLIIAAGHVAQAALLIQRERQDVLSHRDVSHLGELAEGLKDLIHPLQRIGRAMQPDTPPEPIPPPLAPADQCVAAVEGAS